jgi:pyruvate kinase
VEPTDAPVAIRRTKLICTIGPASRRRIDELVAAGMEVARLNLSHGSAASHATAAELVRRVAAAVGRPVAIMTDLAGPKIRLGELAGDTAQLERGHRFTLSVPSAIGDVHGASVSSRTLPREVRSGDRILLADGAVELRVTSTDDRVVETEVVQGGRIRSRQGVSVPAERVSSPPLTARDRRDLPRALALGPAYIAQSFVRRATDVRALRDILGPDGPAIVAKIETRPAIDDFDAIIGVADAVMIARGDMGVELPFEEVPIVQKQLIRRALERGVPSIVATQMLESMTGAPRPTRAEVSDVANAVFDGADAILLSAETAIGAYPVLAAEAAVRVIRHCEEDGAAYLPVVPVPAIEHPERAVSYAAVALAGARSDIDAIVCATRTGRTARMLAALRPRVPVIAVSAEPGVVAALALVHGVVPRLQPALRAPASEIVRALVNAGDLPPGATTVHLASSGPPGSGPDVIEVLSPPT